MKNGFSAFVLMALFMLCGISAYATNGYVIAIEGKVVYIDLTYNDVSVGDELNVYASDATAPTCKLKVIKTGENYSECEAIPAFSLNRITLGMQVGSQPTSNQNALNANLADTSVGVTEQQLPSLPTVNSKPKVMIGNAQVNDITGIGYFGIYVADMLQDQLLKCDDITLVDPTIYRTINEMSGFQINPKFDIQSVKYILMVTMQKPDVTNVSNGVPLQSIMGALSSATGKDLGAQYMSDVSWANLKAAVSINVRVVDIESGDVVFSTTGKGTASGKAQLSLEYGALGGTKMNDGAQGFRQTITGQAIQKAFNSIGRDLNTFFSGKATSNVMGVGHRGSDRLEARGLSIYQGTEKLDDDDLKSIFSATPKKYFDYKSAKKKANIWGNVMFGFGLIQIATPIGAIIAFGAEDVDYVQFLPCVGIGAAFIGGGCLYKSRCKRKVKNIVDEYNLDLDKNNVSSVGNTDIELDFGLLNSGIGFRLTF